MIANLVTTLLLALGVATGSYQSESGNAFNNEKLKPSPKRAVQQVDTTYQWNQVQLIGQVNKEFKKYNLDSKQVVYDQYYGITNTAYQIITTDSQGTTHTAEIFIVLKIQNYWDSQISVELDNLIEIGTNSNVNIYNQDDIFISQNDIYDQYLNLTLTANIQNQMTDLYLELYRNNTATIDYTHYQTLNSNVADQQGQIQRNISTNQITLNRQEAIYIISHNVADSPNATRYCHYIPKQTRIRGNINAPDLEVEVVDIPNLMFTIITLPFAWYSTAFNLTIFPGTPYQLNFGNLVMTIVAALILLYLIRKIIK